LKSAPMTAIKTILQQLREERARLDRAIVALESMAGNTAPRRMGRVSPARTRRTMSPAARRRIAAAQRERWKRVRASQRSVRKRSVGRKAASRLARGRRRILSPKGLARIRAAQRKRWAKVRAGKKEK